MENTDNVTPPRLTVQQVRAQLKRGDVTLIAERAGRAQGHVSQVLAGTRADRKVARVVARKLRIRLSDLPTEMYAA